MPKGKHMNIEMREIIQDGVAASESARSIAGRLSVSPSTVTREVRNNRTVRELARNPKARLAVRCARYRGCEVAGGACERCHSVLVHCRDCRTHSCVDSCPAFELRMCPRTGRLAVRVPAKVSEAGRAAGSEALVPRDRRRGGAPRQAVLVAVWRGPGAFTFSTDRE